MGNEVIPDASWRSLGPAGGDFSRNYGAPYFETGPSLSYGDGACYWHRKQHDYPLPRWNLPKKDSINIYDDPRARVICFDTLRRGRASCQIMRTGWVIGCGCIARSFPTRFHYHRNISATLVNEWWRRMRSAFINFANVARLVPRKSCRTNHFVSTLGAIFIGRSYIWDSLKCIFSCCIQIISLAIKDELKMS